MRNPIYIVAILISSSLALSGQNQPTAMAKPTVLFVCEHGAARSVIASAYFNRIAKQRKLNFTAIFRGTDPQDSLTEGTKRGLIKDGFDVSWMKPGLVSNEDVSNAYQVVTFDCQLPADQRVQNRFRWDGIPPISEDYTLARNQIEKKVNDLITQLLKTSNVK